jgi:hypothetical protein
VVERGSLRLEDSAPHAEIIERARLRLGEESRGSKRDPIALLEVSLNSVLISESTDDAEQLQRIGHLLKESGGMMVTSFPETYRLAQYLNRYTNEPIRFAMGVSSLMQLFEERYYGELDGGIVEALGRFLSQNVKLYIVGMPAEEVRARLAASNSESSQWDFPSEGMVTHDDVRLTTAGRHLFRYMSDTGALLEL